MSRYTATDYRTPREIRAVHYDRLRSEGVGRVRALEVASRATEKFQRDVDRNARGSGSTTPLRSAGNSNPLRVPFSWESGA